jgi:hypothetical protein
MRALLLCALFACRDSAATVATVAPVPLGVPPPVDANPDAILPLPPVPDALPPIDALATPQ